MKVAWGVHLPCVVPVDGHHGRALGAGYVSLRRAASWGMKNLLKQLIHTDKTRKGSKSATASGQGSVIEGAAGHGYQGAAAEVSSSSNAPQAEAAQPWFSPQAKGGAGGGLSQ